MTIKKELKAKFKPVLFPKAYSTNEFPIYLRIFCKAKSSYVSTGYNIPLGAWNRDKAEVYESMPTLTTKLKECLSNEEIKAFRKNQKEIILLPDAIKINSEIKILKGKLEELQNKMILQNKTISSKNIKSEFENKDFANSTGKDFIKYMIMAKERKYNSGKFRTAKTYNRTINKIKAFQKNKPLSIDELNITFIKDFEFFLNKQGYHNNYIHATLRVLRTIIQKEAIKEDNLFPAEKNPFLNFKMPEIKPTIKEKLTIQEIEKIENLEIPEHKKLFHIKNVILFCFYCAGIRIGDLLMLTWDNFKEGRLIYEMGKTDKIQNIKLGKKALEILKYYHKNQNKKSDFIFPFLDNNADYSKLKTYQDLQMASPELLAKLYRTLESKTTTVNIGLKKIAELLEIRKNLSSHIARHSFSDIARRKQINIYDISKLLKHSSVKTTEKYLNSLDTESEDSAMDTMFD